MRLLYVKPELRDLSQGSRIAFVRQLRHLSQDYVSDYLGLTGECKRRSMTRYEKGDRNPKDERVKKIAELRAILADHKLLLGVIKDEISITAEKYGDDRRTKIGFDDEMSMEDLISDDDTVITMTNLGYIKRMTVDSDHNDRRRKDYNQAIFHYDDNGGTYAVWYGMDMEMVLQCFDDAVKDWRRTWCDVANCTRK